MIFHSTKLDSDELQVIESIRDTYMALKYALSTPAKWNGVLRRNTFARAIRGSNSIEGYVVTAEDAMAAAEGEEPLDAEKETWLAVTNYRNAMTYVLQLAKDPNFVFDQGFLRSLHFMMMHYDLSKYPGNWRPGPIYVRDENLGENVYEGPPAEIVPKLVEELITYVTGPTDSDHLLIKASMAHLNLVMIHPFSDGNGRMGRCLQTLVLAKGGINDPTFSSIEEYLGRNTQDYYDVLALVGKGSWNPQNNTKEWVRFNLTAHYRQSLTLARRIRIMAKLWGELEREVEQAGLPERAVFALIDVANGYNLRAAHYRSYVEVSKVVASRDLKAIVKAGLLIPSGERRGRFYTASDRVEKLATRIRAEEPKRIMDPFE